MDKKTSKYQFTLVEVLIAMGICVVGVCSIMVLFPVGATAARDASMYEYAPGAVEQVLHFAKYCVENDESGAAFQLFSGGWDPDASPALYDGPDTPPTSDGITEDTAEAPLPPGSVFSDIKSMLSTNGADVKFYHNGGIVLKVTYKTEIYEDFSCFISLWPEEISFAPSVGAPVIILPGCFTLHAEVSWPADLDYAARQKARYSMDIFKLK